VADGHLSVPTERTPVVALRGLHTALPLPRYRLADRPRPSSSPAREQHSSPIVGQG
jgi:hypothetical protein